ncbi:MAG: murein biosynthesis integral membrane protein MurJ, partial [Leptotrichiaceae bacterium]
IILLVSLKKRYIDINVIKYVKFVTTAILTSLAAFYTSALVNVSRAGVFEVIIKVMVFAIVYLLLWSYTYYKKRINMFN